MTSIDWASLNWEAFATMTGSLATVIVGLAAVRGAYKVGSEQAGISRRQADIMAKQTDILSRQLDIQEKDALTVIFDRKLSVYKLCSELLFSITMDRPDQFIKIYEKITSIAIDAKIVYPNDIGIIVINAFKFGQTYSRDFLPDIDNIINDVMMITDKRNDLENLKIEIHEFFIKLSKVFLPELSFPKI